MKRSLLASLLMVGASMAAWIGVDSATVYVMKQGTGGLMDRLEKLERAFR